MTGRDMGAEAHANMVDIRLWRKRIRHNRATSSI